MQTKERNDGGSAYPAMAHHADRWPTGGMSLRDHFAGLALQGILCRGFIPNRVQPDESVLQDYNYAKLAYELADAMLVARRLDNTGAVR